jgi:hypothetical protein
MRGCAPTRVETDRRGAPVAFCYSDIFEQPRSGGLMKAILIFLSAMLASAAIAIAQPLPGTPAAAPAPAANPCDTCGSVTSVQYVEKKGEGSGAGANRGAWWAVPRHRSAPAAGDGRNHRWRRRRRVRWQPGRAARQEVGLRRELALRALQQEIDHLVSKPAVKKGDRSRSSTAASLPCWQTDDRTRKPSRRSGISYDTPPGGEKPCTRSARVSSRRHWRSAWAWQVGPRSRCNSAASFSSATVWSTWARSSRCFRPGRVSSRPTRDRYGRRCSPSSSVRARPPPIRVATTTRRAARA